MQHDDNLASSYTGVDILDSSFRSLSSSVNSSATTALPHQGTNTSTKSLVHPSLKGVSSRNPPDLITVTLAKVFVHTFLQETPESLQDQAWAIGPNEVRRLFVLAPRVMLFAHRPLCSLCHPHLSTIAWRSDLCTKLSSAEANEDLLPWKLNAAVVQARHLAQLAMKRHKSREAATAAYHGSIVPPEASRASLHTRRFVSLVEALECDVQNYDDEMRAEEASSAARFGEKAHHHHHDDVGDDDDSSSSDEEEMDSSSDDDDDEAEDDTTTGATLLVKNVESGVFFASKQKSAGISAEEREQRRRTKMKLKEEAKLRKQQRRRQQKKQKSDALHHENNGNNSSNTSRPPSASTSSPSLSRHSNTRNGSSGDTIPIGDRWLFLAELHAHIRMCPDKVDVHKHESTDSSSADYNAVIHNILTSQLPARSSAKIEATKCIDRWRTNPQVMGMLRSMFKRLATLPSDPVVARRNATALKKSLSMRFDDHNNKKRNNNGDVSQNEGADGKSDKAVLKVMGDGMTPSDFDAEGGHLRRRLSRVFSSFRDDENNNNNEDPSSSSSNNKSNNNNGSEYQFLEQQAYISVSSFVLFQQRLFSTLYHATSDEQVICAALLDFILDSDYVGGGLGGGGGLFNGNNPNNSAQQNMMLKSTSSSFAGFNRSSSRLEDDDADEFDEMEAERKKREQFKKKELSSFARLSSNALSKKLADEIAVAEEQRERERIISANDSSNTVLDAASKRASILDMKDRMKEKVMLVARQLSKNSELYVDKKKTSSSNNNNSIFRLTSANGGDNSNNTNNNNTTLDLIVNNNNNTSSSNNLFSDDLLVKAQTSAQKQAAVQKRNRHNNNNNGAGSSSNNNGISIISGGGGGPQQASSSSTAAVSGISNTAKNLLQVRDFGKFGVFFEGFCKFMFELCDNWAASHSIDGVAAFLGFLCRVSFPHPIDTIWARNHPNESLKKEEEQRAKKQQQKEKEDAEKERLRNANLDTAFDILEQRAAEEAAEDEEDEDGKKKKKKGAGGKKGDIMASIIEASKKNARKSMFDGNNNKKKGGLKNNKNDISDSSMPQIIVHSPDFAEDSSGRKEHNNNQMATKKDRKKVTFKVDIVDDYASDDSDNNNDDDEVSDKQTDDEKNNDNSTTSPKKHKLKASQRYKDGKRTDSEGDGDNNSGDTSDDNRNREDQKSSVSSTSSDENNQQKASSADDKDNNHDDNDTSSQQSSSSSSVDSSPGIRKLRKHGRGSSFQDDATDDGLLDDELQNMSSGNNNNEFRTPMGSIHDGSRRLSANPDDSTLLDSLHKLPSMAEFTPNLAAGGYKNTDQFLSFRDDSDSGNGRSSLSGDLSSMSIDDIDALLHAAHDHQRKLSISSSENLNSGLLPPALLVAKNDSAKKTNKKIPVINNNNIHDQKNYVPLQMERIFGDKSGRSQRNQVTLLMELLRRKKEKIAHANQGLRHRQDETKTRLLEMQKKQDENEYDQLLVAFHTARDAVLDRYSHVLPALPPKDKDGNPIKKPLFGKSAKPFAERHYLFDGSYYNNNNNNKDTEMQKQRQHQRPLTSSSSSARSTSTSSMHHHHQRKVYPMMETTFETDPPEERKVLKAKEVLLKSVSVGGSKIPLSAKKAPTRPSTSSSSTRMRFVRGGGMMGKSSVQNNEQEEQKTPPVKMTLEIVSDSDDSEK